MKANFKTKKPDESNSTTTESAEHDEVTEEEFEDYMSKMGAAGSFMVFRSTFDLFVSFLGQRSARSG